MFPVEEKSKIIFHDSLLLNNLFLISYWFMFFWFYHVSNFGPWSFSADGIANVIQNECIMQLFLNQNHTLLGEIILTEGNWEILIARGNLQLGAPDFYVHFFGYWGGLINWNDLCCLKEESSPLQSGGMSVWWGESHWCRGVKIIYFRTVPWLPASGQYIFLRIHSSLSCFPTLGSYVFIQRNIWH